MNSHRFAFQLISLLYLIKQGWAQANGCLETPQGINYLGNLATSDNGPCTFWFNASGNANFKSDSQFLDITVRDAANFCRNPKSGSTTPYEPRPWCWLASNPANFGYCTIPNCTDIGVCRDSYLGETYRGTIKITVGGLACQHWDTQTPHAHPFNASNWPNTPPTETIAQAGNRCRNPNNSSVGLWCYTVNPSVVWQPCISAVCNSTFECVAGKTPYTFKSLTRTEQYLFGCEKWSSVPLSQYTFSSSLPSNTQPSPLARPPLNPALLPDLSLAISDNFCRNPDNDPDGAWCYVLNITVYTKKYCKTPCTGIWACLYDRVGQYYQGNMAQTEINETCLPWASSSFSTSTGFPDKSVTDASNYCRNPDSNPGGPWCFVASSKKFGFCSLPVCMQTPPIPPLQTSPNTSLCQLTALGIEYTGTVTVSQTGATCQTWSTRTPTDHPYFNRPQLFNVATMAEVANYCRNPNNLLTGPWCYTIKDTVESCNLPKCYTTVAPTLPPGPILQCRTTLEGTEYNGHVNTTAAGLPCMRWDSIVNLAYPAADFPEKNLQLAQNYCRNPKRAGFLGTFCYVIVNGATEQKPCVVPLCNSSQCRTTSEGYTYTGSKSISKSSKPCIPWTNNTNNIEPNLLPDASLSASSNFCRNPLPSNYFDGPFCYTASGAETCGINFCTPQCRSSLVGTEYAGLVNYAGGPPTMQTCRRWDDISNILYRDPTELNAATLSGASNFCRNPDNDTRGPWCYTSPQTKGYCRLPACVPSGNCFSPSSVWAYTGTQDVTQNGIACVPWKGYSPTSSLPGPAYVPSLLPDASEEDAKNYCRSPTSDPEYNNATWCYIDIFALFAMGITPSSSIGFCSVDQCTSTATPTTTPYLTTAQTTHIPYTTVTPTLPPGLIHHCRTTVEGTEYNGHVSTTAVGLPCMRWDSIVNLAYPAADFPEKNLQLAQNYCRNPKRTGFLGTFCYATVNGATQQQPCVVPLCNASHCRTTSEGYTYSGNQSTTKSGKPCLPWTQNVNNIRPNLLPDASLYASSNFCRNPISSNIFDGPYCHTYNGCESCGINYCTPQCRSSPAGTEYAGVVSYTSTPAIRECRRWDDIRNTLYRNPAELNAATLSEASNFCRNPDNDTRGPWCYTSSQTKGFCQLPTCATTMTTPSSSGTTNTMTTPSSAGTTTTMATPSSSGTTTTMTTPSSPGTILQCRVTVRGTEYNGHVSKTADGRPCLSWSSIPNLPYSAMDFPEGSVTLAQNFCRNPKRPGYMGTFCYAKVNGSALQKPCVVPLCNPSSISCLSTPEGYTYSGNQSISSSGQPCLLWTSNLNNIEPNLLPDDSVCASNNYCRNPNSENLFDGPYCYTQDGPETCGINLCTILQCRMTVRGTEYNGHVSTTADGRPCLSWSSIPNLPYSAMDFPEGSVTLAQNFCRNPKRPGYMGTFCYAMVNGSALQKPCVVRLCNTSDCLTTAEGYSYSGNQSISSSGKPCLPWTNVIYSIEPNLLPDNSVCDSNNHCRNPNSENVFNGPYCYTSDGPESCNIDHCSSTTTMKRPSTMSYIARPSTVKRTRSSSGISNTPGSKKNIKTLSTSKIANPTI